MLDASTALWFSAFHLLITLFEKKYLVMSLVHFTAFIINYIKYDQQDNAVTGAW